MYNLYIAKIIISSFRFRVEMQRLEELKQKISFSLNNHKIFQIYFVFRPKLFANFLHIVQSYHNTCLFGMHSQLTRLVISHFKYKRPIKKSDHTRPTNLKCERTANLVCMFGNT